MPLTEPNAKTLAAAGLIRAGLADDADAGVLIIQQNGGQYPGDTGQLEELVIAVTALSVRVLLSACGWDVDQAVKIIEQWQENYAKHPATRRTA
jgi:hypothetical protein